jgi:hypothetical protein
MRNSTVASEDKENINLPLRDTKPSPNSVPDITPVTEAVPSGARKHMVMAIDPDTGKMHKPPLVKRREDGFCFNRGRKK